MTQVQQWWERVLARMQPGAAPDDGGAAVVVVLALALAAVMLPPVWWRVRVLVTVVHELGHGLVGVLVGRRFTGLVLRPDMSGHAVTMGRSRGPARVLTTWAGYPAPGVVGAGLVQLAATGWSPPVLGVVALVLLVCLVRVRSVYTAVVMVVVTAGAGVLWWSGADDVQAAVLLGVGVFLVLGAWRHLGTVALPGRRSSGSDPVVLARLTRVPALLWNLSFAVVLGGASWLVVRQMLGPLGG